MYELSQYSDERDVVPECAEPEVVESGSDYHEDNASYNNDLAPVRVADNEQLDDARDSSQDAIEQTEPEEDDTEVSLGGGQAAVSVSVDESDAVEFRDSQIDDRSDLDQRPDKLSEVPEEEKEAETVDDETQKSMIREKAVDLFNQGEETRIADKAHNREFDSGSEMRGFAFSHSGRDLVALTPRGYSLDEAEEHYNKRAAALDAIASDADRPGHLDEPVTRDDAEKVLVNEEAQGFNVFELTDDEILGIEERHLLDMVPVAEYVDAKGLGFDGFGRNNYFYDPDAGFTVIDTFLRESNEPSTPRQEFETFIRGISLPPNNSFGTSASEVRRQLAGRGYEIADQYWPKEVGEPDGSSEDGHILGSDHTIFAHPLEEYSNGRLFAEDPDDVDEYALDQEDRRLAAVKDAPNLAEYTVQPKNLQFARRVDLAAAEALYLYSEVSGLDIGEIQQLPGSCGQMTIILQRLLEERGIGTVARHHRNQDGTSHYYLRSEEYPNDPVNIDSTWQQKLDWDSTDGTRQPHTLVVPSSLVSEAVRAYDIREDAQTTWSSGEDVEMDWKQYPDPDLERVFRIKHWS